MYKIENIDIGTKKTELTVKNVRIMKVVTPNRFISKLKAISVVIGTDHRKHIFTWARFNVYIQKDMIRQ